MAKKATEEKVLVTGDRTREEKAKALEVALSALDKQFGKGTVRAGRGRRAAWAYH